MPENLIQVSSSSQKEFRSRRRFSKAETNKGQESTLTAATINESRDWRLNPQRFSSWTRLLRVHAWVCRFLDNCCLSKHQQITGELTIVEIRNAENQIIAQAQQQAFPDEYRMLAQGTNLPHSSKLLQLRPVFDEDELVRCDGRLRYAEYLPYDTLFPIILPRGHWVTTLIVKHYHEKGYHASGTNQTLADLSSRFRIIAARDEIRAWETNCTECRKRKAKPASQVMTAFTGAEALISSRPLTYQSANPSDDVPLMPKHFLHGQIGGQFAPESVDDNKNLNIKKRWRRIQELVKHFWRRWMRKWLPNLNSRKKWLKT